jgi:hypothetical protein
MLAFVIKVEECFSRYIMLSMILQFGGLAGLIGGIRLAVLASDSFDPNIKKGKFDFWCQ